MIELHELESGTSIWYNPSLVAQVFEGDGKTFIHSAGITMNVRESVGEVLALL